MTALREYQRLETTGIWRPAPGAQRRDVTVAIGKATLVLTDMSDRALAHWSLAALERRDDAGAGGPAVYAPGPDATEDLEIADPEMIAAIERVRDAVARSRPAPGRLRARIALGVGLAAVLGLALWLPDALIRHAARTAPEAARTAIAETLLDDIARLTGPACTSPGAERALARLAARVLGTEGVRLTVLPSGPAAEVVALPGGVILVSRALVEDHETPEVVAGYLLAEHVAGKGDPLLALLDWSGTGAALTLLTRGTVPPDRLASYAEALLARPPQRPDDARLAAAFAAAGLRIAPYAYARDVTGESTLSLIEADPVPPEAARPILSDGEWVALQGICGP